MARLFPRLLAGLSILLISLIAAAAQAQTPPPASAFLWEMRDLELSPDGRYLSMIQPYEGRTALVIYPLGGGEPTLIEPGQRDQDENLEVSNHFWSGNDRILVEVNWNYHYQSTRANFRTEQTRMLSIRPDGRDATVLFETRQDSMTDVVRQTNIVDTLTQDDDHILVALQECGSVLCVGAVHKVDINTGRSVIVARGGDNTFGWATDSNGHVRVRLDIDEGVYKLYTREPGSASWRQIMSRPRFDDVGNETTLAPDSVVGDYIYLQSDHEGRDGFYRMSLDGGGMERFYLHDTYDMGSLDVDTETDSIRMLSYLGHITERVFFDEELEADYERYNRLIPGDFVSLIEENDDENLRILAGYGLSDPTIYYLMDDNAQTISELGQRHPQLHPGNLGPVSLVTYQARDGLEISGYLVLPPGTTAEDGPFPFVMFPHGGPNARDSMTFDGIRQFLATRGYAVFAPQFRGSRGFGNEFLRAGFEEWGGAMQDDLTDATNYLVEQGIADPDHMCIFGWSYSAYAAVMAAVKTPDLYNCAAGINGVYDLPELQGDLITSRAWTSLQFWQNTMGSDERMLAQVSPTRRVDEIRIPILILASQEDQIAPYEDSVRVIAAMRRANVDLDSHIYEYGNHSLDYRPNRIDAYERVARFLDQHM